MRPLEHLSLAKSVLGLIVWAIAGAVASAQDPRDLSRNRAILLPPQELTQQETAPGFAADSSAQSRNELSVDWLIGQVIARNPSLEQMAAAYRAASARYPQVTSLDDPMLGAYAAPGAFGSNSVNGGYRIEVSQKFFYPGKRALRGDNALAEARAACNDVEDMRLQLVESATSAFYDFFLVERAMAVNEENLRLLREFKQNAESRFQTGLAIQQDVQQAEVEIGRQLERQIELEHQRKISQARINTLMHEAPDAPLPSPPAQAALKSLLPDASALRSVAVSRRPDLQALANRIAAEEASLALAYKDRYPDVEVMAAYDAFWQERPLQTTVGVKINLPVRLARRQGAIEEARAKIAERRAELEKQVDQVNFQVQEAYEQVRQRERIVGLYEKTILPAAAGNLQAARTAYVTGKVSFLNLIEAQRTVVTLKDRYYESVADYHRRLAGLERVIGGRFDVPAAADRLRPGR
ncbi:MAG TPA: TolC family protein [Gemmataceae bacterium]|jgi:outer membrane protein TolC|nr:TolC family protein [Gemmataceae bacterium]